MFPWVYEFRWSTGHLVFLGIFFTVALVILSTAATAAVRAYKDFRKRTHEKIQWEVEFEDLPAPARVCRHELSGEVNHRTCDHEFDCRTCTVHPKFLARSSPEAMPEEAGQNIFGLTLPIDRLYHRGHTWVKLEEDGICTVGLDDFGTRLIGTPDEVQLPDPGNQVRTNGTGWCFRKKNATVRILSPIDGEVIEKGGPEQGWYLKVRIQGSEANTRHLLRGNEIRPWIMRELERLQLSLATDGAGLTLADGGELVSGIWDNYPDLDWDGVWGEIFLQA